MSLEIFGSTHDVDPSSRRTRERLDATTARHFLPRHVVGEKLSEAWQTTLSQAEALGFSITHIRASALDLRRKGSAWAVDLSDGSSIKTGFVILALGLLATDRFPGLSKRKNYVADPWQSFASIADIKHAESVCIIGTGPTAIDWALRIFEAGFKGRIHLVSRAGRLPAARPVLATTPIEPITTRGYIFQHFDRHGEFDPATVEQLITSAFERAQVPRGELARWVALHRQGGTALLEGTCDLAHEPQPVFEALKHIDHLASTIWKCSSPKAKNYILRHLARLHSDLSFALPVHNAYEALLRIRDNQMTLSCGFRDAQPQGDGFLIQGLHGSTPYEFEVEWVINATGFSGSLEHSTNPLVRSMVQKGLLFQSPFGGAHVRSARGQVLGSGGAAIEGLFTSGGSLASGATYMVNSLADTSEQGLDVGFAVAFELMARGHHRAKTL